MNLTIENILLVGSLLLLISILVGKTSYRFGIPTLVLFLFVGMLAGSEGIGRIHFDNPQLAQFIGVVSLNFILFSGGLDTNWLSIKPVLWQGISLSTLGVLLTAVSLGLFVWWLTDFNLYEGLLLGAIVSSTDAAAVFSILRAKSLGLKNQLKPTLELESGSNDPMAYILTIAFLSLVANPGQSLLSIIPLFLQQMLLGALAGFLFGKLTKFIVNKIQLTHEGLYPALVIGLMFITFSATDFVGGNGFLAIYICAVYLANQDFIHKGTIIKMFDSLAWLMQIVLFLTLGLLVFPSQILPVIGVGLVISLFLIFIARPLSVLIALTPFKMKMNRRLYISWVGLRGAVPIVFATYPLLAGIEKANMIFNIVFFISLTSVLVQGTTLNTIARWLQVSAPELTNPLATYETFLSEQAKKIRKEITIPEDGLVAGKKIVDLHFPRAALIAMINRGTEFLTPNGATIIAPKDKLIVLADDQESMNLVYECLKVTPAQKVI
ncbi:potassium/proton antiporter [Sunxiuqinia sp. sy24]|uniref:potassium/proton antiporter n=1 Tax=Sunxiuqinia sp. sy24 TaxID=3461495 RepID=UPI00404599AC